MQSDRSPGMASPALGNHPLAPQGEWIAGRIGGDHSSIPAESALGQAMISLGYMDAPVVNHKVVVFTAPGDEALFACGCGYDTGVEAIHRCIVDMEVHQRFSGVRSQCGHTATAVEVAR